MLDHGFVQHYTLKVGTMGNSFSSLSSEAFVRIYILDINDRFPIFNQFIYESFT